MRKTRSQTQQQAANATSQPQRNGTESTQTLQTSPSLSEINEVKEMLAYFRVFELQRLLLLLTGSHSKQNTRKIDLQGRIVELLDQNFKVVAPKIRDIYKLSCADGNIVTPGDSGAPAAKRIMYQPQIQLPVQDVRTAALVGNNVVVPFSTNMTSGYPIHPDVSLRKLAFYDVLATLIQPSTLVPANTQRLQEAAFFFTLTPQQATDIASNRDIRNGSKVEHTIQVQLRFCLLETSCEQEDCFPPNVIVKVNNKLCPLPNPIPTNRPNVEPKRPPRPVNVTSNVKLSPTVTNSISVSWCPDFTRGYVVSAYLVRKLTSLQLLNRMKQKGIKAADYTRALIKEKLNEDADCEIATTMLRVSLICPLGKMRMTIPCRASTCSHLQCFDASLFLQMNERKPTWNCPVCDKPAVYETLVIDGYFQEVLASAMLSTDDNEIQLHKDGSWSTHSLRNDTQVLDTPHKPSQKIEVISDDLEVITDEPEDDKPVTKLAIAPIGISAAGIPATLPGAAVTGTANNEPTSTTNSDTVDLTLSDSEDDLPLRRKAVPKPANNIGNGQKVLPNANKAKQNDSIISLDSPSPPSSPSGLANENGGGPNSAETYNEDNMLLKAESSTQVLPLNPSSVVREENSIQNFQHLTGSSSTSSSNSSSSSCSADSSFEEDDDSIKNPNFTVQSIVSNNDSSADDLETNSILHETVPSSCNLSHTDKQSRKRKANPKLWKQNQRKYLRNLGLAYKTKQDIVKEEKQLKTPCNERCRYKCTAIITEEERKQLLKEYWDLCDITRQRNYINKHTEPILRKYRYTVTAAGRDYNRAYYFNLMNKKIRVCKKFFMSTLDINDRVIKTVIQKQTSAGTIEEDMRGRHQNQRRVPDEIRCSIRNHIESIPRIESHYLHQQTTRKYIDGGKSIADLYRDYKNECTSKGNMYGTYTMYNRIFNFEFNLGFYIPKKDQCELCAAYNDLQAQERQNLEEKYVKHQEEKKLSREEKEIDKIKVDSNYIVAVYDLQAVLRCPKGDVSVFYYKSKLNTFNLTLTELKTKKTECFVWHEGEGNRGSDEIGTCVYKYIQMKLFNELCDTSSDIGKEFVFYSGNCYGQNKNKYIIALYIFAVLKFVNVKSITHKFLITGHTQNENDSVHSIIEKRIKQTLKSGPIYVPAQYAEIIRAAKQQGEPFHLNELSHDDFISLKSLASDLKLNFRSRNISHLKVVKLEKKKPNLLFYKESYADKEFSEMRIYRQSPTKVPDTKAAYKNKISLSHRKVADLKSLMEKNYIPSFYASFYNSVCE